MDVLRCFLDDLREINNIIKEYHHPQSFKTLMVVFRCCKRP